LFIHRTCVKNLEKAGVFLCVKEKL